MQIWWVWLLIGLAPFLAFCAYDFCRHGIRVLLFRLRDHWSGPIDRFDYRIRRRRLRRRVRNFRRKVVHLSDEQFHRTETRSRRFCRKGYAYRESSTRGDDETTGPGE